MKKSKFIEKVKKFKLNRPGRRQLILCLLIIMIAVAGYINLNYEGTEDAIPTSATVTENISTDTIDVFANSQIDKEESRSASMAIYREIIDNANSSEDAKLKAESDLAACAKAIENESIIENMLASKGFTKVMAYIASDSVNIVVQTDGLVPSEVAQIKDIVVETTGFEPSAVKIAEVN